MTQKLPPPFPLAWPEDWPRSVVVRPSAYRVSFVRAREQCLKSLSRYVGTALNPETLIRDGRIVMTTNAPVRLDGLPYANTDKYVSDAGVAVWWLAQGTLRVLACDRWKDLRSNVRALGLAFDALSLLKRSGASEVFERASQAFEVKALPEPTPIPAWFEVLGLKKWKPSLEEIRKAFQALVLKHHPDHGGGAEAFIKIKSAYDEARRWAGGVK